MREYDSQAVVWQTAINPVIALELLATGVWTGTGVLGPEAFDAVPFLDLLTASGSPGGRREGGGWRSVGSRGGGPKSNGDSSTRSVLAGVGRRLPVGLGELEAVELERRGDDAADERPRSERPRGLPGSGRHDGLEGALAVRQVAAEPRVCDRGVAL